MATLVVKVPDTIPLREPGCMSCVVDAMEWGWGEQAGCISKIVTFVIVLFATVIAVFSLIGIPFVFCTIYEYAGRNTAEHVNQAVHKKIVAMTQANDRQQDAIAEKDARLEELRAGSTKRHKENRALKAQIKALQQQVGNLEGQLKETHEAPKGSTLKTADIQPYRQKIKELQEQVERLEKENASLKSEHDEKEGLKSLTQQGMAIAAALMQLRSSIPQEDKEGAIKTAMSVLAKGFTEQEKNISTAWHILHDARASEDPEAQTKAVTIAIKILEGKQDQLQLEQMPTMDSSDSEAEDDAPAPAPAPAQGGKKLAGSDPGPSCVPVDHKEPASKKPQPQVPAKVPSNLNL